MAIFSHFDQWRSCRIFMLVNPQVSSPKKAVNFNCSLFSMGCAWCNGWNQQPRVALLFFCLKGSMQNEILWPFGIFTCKKWWSFDTCCSSETSANLEKNNRKKLINRKNKILNSRTTPHSNCELTSAEYSPVGAQFFKEAWTLKVICQGIRCYLLSADGVGTYA